MRRDREAASAISLHAQRGAKPNRGGTASEVFAWTLVPWALLVIAVRRAAPHGSRFTGALVGAAAWGLTFAALRLCCQTEELLHLSVFHVLPLVTGTLLSAVLGPVLLGEWRA